ncbi:MAG: hypothetical protein KAJ30_06995, partial [Candidatus Heimdallarchaeota archaeon]|nr:hypothetical protein [Candidatus Heimdallarchaeota archaeon]
KMLATEPFCIRGMFYYVLLIPFEISFSFGKIDYSSFFFRSKLVSQITHTGGFIKSTRWIFFF